MTGTPFTLAVRVYYEDTDAGGVVYYANYLKFMERARTEWLASLGFDVAALARDANVAFVVLRANVEFRAPARLSDTLDVTVALVERGRARVVADQQVRRGNELVAQARITLACIEPASWRPARKYMGAQAPIKALIAGLTSSSNSTVSPITIVDLPIGVKAAHEVRPMNVGTVQRSTLTLTSSRGLLTLKTFSALLYVPFRPVTDSMVAVSMAGTAA